MDAKTPTRDARFDEVITTAQDLRKIVGPANRWFTSKILTRLDRNCRNYIAASPFVVVGSTDLLSMVDLSPKGDRAGFVRCLDDSTVAVPDRRGNRRVDTFHNVLHNPGVGLIFFVPGRRETLRVAGRAMIVRDVDIRNAMAENGRVPELALVVVVERAFFHCGKVHHPLEPLGRAGPSRPGRRVVRRRARLVILMAAKPASAALRRSPWPAAFP
ncbi:MAG: MSMEG_1061 family FMN-dependent PPOX-type flavoprotein [Xanthobacteraceae bacterium]